MSEIYEARNLVLKSTLSFDERSRLAALLGIHLADGTITEANMFQCAGDVRFMARHFPDEPYRPNPLTSGTLVRYGHTIASACRGDYASLASEALTAAARRGVIDRIVSAIVPASVSGISVGTASSVVETPQSQRRTPSERDAIKREIRLLILARHRLRTADRGRLIKLLSAHYKKGPVTGENYIRIALEFLRKYYPDDHQEEKKTAQKALTDRNPSSQRPGLATPSALPPPCLPAVGPSPVL